MATSKKMTKKVKITFFPKKNPKKTIFNFFSRLDFCRKWWKDRSDSFGEMFGLSSTYIICWVTFLISSILHDRVAQRAIFGPGSPKTPIKNILHHFCFLFFYTNFLHKFLHENFGVKNAKIFV
mgnify:CR=1 FL=1